MLNINGNNEVDIVNNSRRNRGFPYLGHSSRYVHLLVIVRSKFSFLSIELCLTGIKKTKSKNKTKYHEKFLHPFDLFNVM